MKSKGSVSKKNYRKICAIVVIAEIFSCIALPAMASTRSNETTYTNTTVNTAGYYHNSSEDEIADKYAEIYDKNVAIIGDSISTYEGYIPEGYKYFYSKSNVDSVEKTWWGQLVNKTGVNVVSNCSWSGSTVTGDSTSKTNAHAACSDRRINDLALANEKIDIVICYIGINDYRRNVPVGHWSAEDATPEDSTQVTNFSEGYALMVSKIKKSYPNAKVYVTTLMKCDDTNNKATYSLDGYNEAIRQAADKFDAEVVDLNQFMIEKNDYADYSLDRLHPNASGHERMSTLFAETLLN
jgi:lysophospholipase L1-like esterase